MSELPAVLRAYRREFELFRGKYGTVGVVILCKLDWKSAGIEFPATGCSPPDHVWDLTEDKILWAREFPSRAPEPNDTEADPFQRVIRFDGRSDQSFQGAGLRSAQLQILASSADELSECQLPENPATSSLQSRSYATPDGQILQVTNSTSSTTSRHQLSGGVMELRFFGQLHGFDFELEKLQKNVLKALENWWPASEILREFCPALKFSCTPILQAHLWAELVYWVSQSKFVHSPYVIEKWIPAQTSYNIKRKLWSSLSQKKTGMSSIPADRIPICWCSGLKDLAAASVVFLDVLAERFGKSSSAVAIIPPEPATNLEPIITGSAPAGGEATPASKLNAWPEEIKEKLLNTATPLEQRIIRFFWERKHASDIQSLIDAAWGDKPDTSVETVKKAIQRLNLKFADNLTISFHPSTDRVQFELLKHSGNSQQPDKSADKF